MSRVYCWNVSWFKQCDMTGSPRRFHCLVTMKASRLFHWAFLSLSMQWPWAKILWSICISCMFAVLAELVCQCTDKYPETTQQIWWMLQILINPFTFYKFNFFVAWWYFNHRYCLLSYTVNTTHQNDLRQKKYICMWTSNTHESQWMCSMTILFLNFALFLFFYICGSVHHKSILL